jgi:hypothetical protein
LLECPLTRVPCSLLVLPPVPTKIQKKPQGEFVDKLAELIIKTYGASNSISKPDIYFIQDKKKQPYFDDDSDADE